MEAGMLRLMHKLRVDDAAVAQRFYQRYVRCGDDVALRDFLAFI